MKEISWFLTTNYSTNMLTSVIVVSHGSLAITSPWLQETIQSMTNKMVLLHSNLHQEQANTNIVGPEALHSSFDDD